MAKETGIVTRIRDRLAKLSRCKAVKNHGSVFSEKGNPDIFGSYCGAAFVLEVKNEAGRLSVIQMHRLIEWQKSGAICGAVRTWDEALMILTGELRQGPREWRKLI